MAQVGGNSNRLGGPSANSFTEMIYGVSGRKGVAPERVLQDYIDPALLSQMGKALAPGVSVFHSLPTAASTGEFFEVIDIFDTEADENYDPSDAGFQFNNYAEEYGARAVAPTAPAPLTLVPTSTSNPEHPRTVAAGFDRQRGVLTVVFRDGTYYNYYNVTADIWNIFKTSRSKGQHVIPDILDFHDRGPADAAQLPALMRQELYRVLSTQQRYAHNHQGGHKNRTPGKIQNSPVDTAYQKRVRDRLYQAKRRAKKP